jgi:hypothetical protein
MEASVIAWVFKDGYVELCGWNSKTQNKTIKKLVKQGWLVGIDDGSFTNTFGNKVYNKFKFNLDKAYYQHI